MGEADSSLQKKHAPVTDLLDYIDSVTVAADDAGKCLHSNHFWKELSKQSDGTSGSMTQRGPDTDQPGGLSQVTGRLTDFGQP